jgi:hypothetical protein
LQSVIAEEEELVLDDRAADSAAGWFAAGGL